MDKKDIQLGCLKKINLQLVALEKILNEILLATATDSKSSAGDKHETSTSMAQLEQEKLTKQINILLAQQNKLHTIKTDTIHQKIGIGSVVITNKGGFYLSVGIGKFETNDSEFFAINPEAPIAQLLIGKKTTDKIIFNGDTLEILNVF